MKLKLNQPHDKSSSSIGRDGIDQQSTQNSQQMGKRDPAKFERRILERIRYEDEFEQERPSFKVKEVDLRKIRLNKVPFEDKPDSKLKNMVSGNFSVRSFVAFELRRLRLLVPEGL
jgi:hypothetical protein